MKTRYPLQWLLLAGAAALYGCSTGEPVRYYLMSPVPAMAPRADHGKMALGVGPIQLADYLKRANVVTRASPSRVLVPYEHKWGASLESHFTGILAENLRDRMGLDGILVYPWQAGTRLDYQLTADVTRFIYSDDRVHLDARWNLRNRKTGASVDGASRIEEPSTQEYDDIVDAMSRATARMADEIAARIMETAK